MITAVEIFLLCCMGAGFAFWAGWMLHKSRVERFVPDWGRDQTFGLSDAKEKIFTEYPAGTEKLPPFPVPLRSPAAAGKYEVVQEFRLQPGQPGVLRVNEELVPGVFKDAAGSPLPVRRVWDDNREKHGLPPIPYEEIGPMFLDQFLLRYFHEVMKPYPDRDEGPMAPKYAYQPWEAFCMLNPWARDMPLLFEQLTSHKLSDLQLNATIAEYVSRLQKPQPAPGGFYCQNCSRVICAKQGDICPACRELITKRPEVPPIQYHP